MKGKGLKGFLGLVLLVLVFGLSACNPAPPFFTHTNLDAPIITGTSGLTDGEGVHSRVFWPGTLNMTALRSGNDLCVYMTMNDYTPYIWDDSATTYRDISSYTQSEIEDLFAGIIEFIPAPSSTPEWTLNAPTSSTPYFCTDYNFGNDFAARTIVEVKVPDLNGANYNFKGVYSSTTHYMNATRVSYFRVAGSANNTFEIVAVNFEAEDTVSLGWSPEITMSTEFGQFIGAMTAPLPNNEVDIIPIVPCSSSVSGGNVTYTLCKTKNFIPDTHYYLVLATAFASNYSGSFAAADTPLTQDLDGNVLEDDASEEFTSGDLGTPMNQSTMGIEGYYVLVHSDTQ